MTGKVRPPGTAAQVSTGGSLISDVKLQALYTSMVHCRLFTERAATVRVKASEVHPYSGSMGQEALAAGWVIDLRPGDTIALAPGDSIPSLVRGVPLVELMAELYALRSGSSQPAGSASNILPATSILDEQLDAIAATAFAHKRKKKGQVVVSFVSAPMMALAPWQKLITRAAKQKLPIIFSVENNAWAPAATLGATDDFSQIAKGYGLTGISVDGNDVVAVYRVAYESLDRVRKGDGPVMIEGKTYSEANRGIRSKPVERDPLIHMERYLRAKKLLKPSWKKQLAEEFTKELKRAAKAARKVSL